MSSIKRNKNGDSRSIFEARWRKKNKKLLNKIDLFFLKIMISSEKSKFLTKLISFFYKKYKNFIKWRVEKDWEHSI